MLLASLRDLGSNQLAAMRTVAFVGSVASAAVDRVALAFVAAAVVAFIGSDSFRKFGKKYALLSCLFKFIMTLVNLVYIVRAL